MEVGTVARETSPDGNLFRRSENNKLPVNSRSLLIGRDGNVRTRNSTRCRHRGRSTTNLLESKLTVLHLNPIIPSINRFIGEIVVSGVKLNENETLFEMESNLRKFQREFQVEIQEA